jgi:acylphosphatase
MVHGMVQGVGYRYTMRMIARDARVAGWVRNLRDGRVEAVFEGPEEDVDALVAWCRAGPRWASVTGVDAVEEDPTGEPGFRIGH